MSDIRTYSDWGLDMSGKNLLEFDPVTGHVQCRDLTGGKVDRPDMSGLGIGDVQRSSLEPGDRARYVQLKDLATG
jgi:hypothetical protein